MKHNLLKSVILSVILALTSASSIYAADITSNGSAILFFNKEAVDWWDSDNAVMSAYFFKDSNNKFAGVAKQYSGNTYYVVIPSGTWSHVILTRHQNGTTTPSWDNDWNQTGNIALQTGKNYIKTFANSSESATWDTQKPTSAASLNASSTTIYTEAQTTLTPSLTSNTTYNEIKSTSYSINPASGASISSNKFTATTPGTYTVTATITYNPKGYTSLTSTVTATKIITVKNPSFVVRGGAKFGNTWGDNTHIMTTKNASEKIVYYTFAIDGTNNINDNKDFQFKIYEKELDKWYGITADGDQFWYTRDMGVKDLSSSGKNIEIRADIIGNYEIKVDYSTDINAPKITVTYPTAYTVTYGIGTKKGTTSVTTSPNITSGDLVLASTSITFSKGATKEGYTWKGWYSNAAGTGTNFGNGTTYTSTNRTGDISVYACYDLITYNITYNLNGGTGATNTTYNVESATITLPAAPTKTGYTFAGWYDNANLTGNKVTQVAKGSTGNKTFYAKWTANQYTITWNANGGSVTPASSTYTYDGEPITLPTPTRAGYTFNGWFTALSGGSKINDVGKDNKPASNKTYYAQWTENKFDVTIGTDGNGTTTNSGIQQVGIVGISVTATPNDGYEFVNWTKTGDVTLSNANTTTTTIKATGTGSVTANFKKIDYKTIYLKPGAWASSNARFAVYAFGNGNEWYDMEQSDCNNEHYQCDINGKYTTVIICRMNPSTSANNFNNGVLWNQTADLTIPAEGMCFYDRTKIYLKPNANWKADGARFAAYFYLNSDGEKHKWMSMLATDEEGVFYCNYPTEEAYDRVVFCRMNGNEEYNDWGNRYDQTNGIDLYTGGNFYTINSGEWGGNGNDNSGAKGTWSYKWKTPTHTVTLEKTTYGKYAVELNGQKYYSSQSEDVVINNVPVESTLRLVSSESFNAAYNNNMCIQTHDGVDFEELNAEHRICGNTIIKENFTTLADHTVYLRVSTSDNEINTNWNQGGHYNYIYSDNNIGGQVITTTSLPDGEIYKETGYNYYKFIIPAGCRTFRFERKTSQNAYYANNTENFLRYLPLGTSNCYTIEKKISDNTDGTKTFNGSRGMSLANGDYRLLYVEQVVTNGDGNESWKTVIKNTYQHSSDIIKKRAVTGTDIVSLHINYDETKHPRIILQQFSNGNWVDVEGEARMAVGPLTANPGRAMLPGRRNTESLTYDDGIEEIKQDKAVNGYAGRVWNFTVQQTVDNGNVTANLLFDPINAMEGRNLEPYSGNYYIRTDNAEGGWMDYTIPDNHMHFSQYALENSGFSHYFCKWVETSKKKNTKFVIANDYGAAISDTLSKDDYTDEHGNIAHDANIRWSWNEYTNEVARAYIQGTWQTGTQNRNRNLVVNYKESSSAGAKEELLDDSGDWIYQKDFTVKVGSHLNSLTAQYPVNTGTIQTFAENLDMLTGDNTNDNAYVVRVLYDFKINKTLIALVPNANQAEIAIDVMIERTNQEPATQVKAPITYNQNQRSGEGSTVYAVMSFTKAHLTDANKSEQEKLTYWISFPFDVTISDVFGFGEVGQYWMIKYYDGAERADIGWFLDTKTFWKYKTKKSDVLKANTGYVLTLNKKVMDPNSPIFTNTNTVSLYFPSTAKITTIDPDVYTVTEVEVPTHKCTITSPADRTTEDSNWNLIGVPSYANKDNVTTNTTVKYFYDYNYKDDTYAVAQNGGTKTFQSMFAYMVQFGGTIDWKSFDFKEGAQGLAAKRNTDSDAEQHNLRLELQQDGNKADHTFIQLQDEDATEMFDMNSDLCKIINAGSNIYSIITAEKTPVNVAGNVLPIQETVIPVGVVISAAGEYTFAMPDGTDGIVVELIDYETNTTTNLLLDNYTVNLGKGTFDNRFALHVKPSKVTTSVEDINTNSNGVKKYLIDGILYMQKDGVLYDAQGKLVR